MKIKSWEEVACKIQSMKFTGSFDMIVAIANGGIIPAALLNQKLQLPIHLLRVSFRDAKQHPIYDSPRLVAYFPFDLRGKKVLLVEDMVKTGATLEYAKELMKEAALVKTFAVNGKADYALYDEPCFNFPWTITEKIRPSIKV